MFVLMISRSSLKLGHLISETSSPGQIKGKPCWCSRGHIFEMIIMNLAQNVCLDDFKVIYSFLRAPVAWWIRELTLNPLGFSPLWFEPSSGHMWESQVLLTDGQVVFLRVLRFSPTFDERSARYKWNILERAVKPKSKKKKKKKKIVFCPVTVLSFSV